MTDDRERDEFEGGTAAPREGEQEKSHESPDTLSPDEMGEDKDAPTSGRD